VNAGALEVAPLEVGLWEVVGALVSLPRAVVVGSLDEDLVVVVVAAAPSAAPGLATVVGVVAGAGVVVPLPEALPAVVVLELRGSADVERVVLGALDEVGADGDVVVVELEVVLGGGGTGTGTGGIVVVLDVEVVGAVTDVVELRGAVVAVVLGAVVTVVVDAAGAVVVVVLLD